MRVRMLAGKGVDDVDDLWRFVSRMACFLFCAYPLQTYWVLLDLWLTGLDLRHPPCSKVRSLM